ncbi:alpha-glucuronidase family glycosyl hydrolase [Novosphingobium sp. P6W]|uniref:alpha-glucuronidase family glycosyl hydrolase n=1 Tax=Novosphingobium sp. P6W TaxID=1609758 RepID=UPI0005C4A7D1|nr:alpha-glucuronidase [Novosphingobium sp. P6W]
MKRRLSRIGALTAAGLAGCIFATAAMPEMARANDGYDLWLAPSAAGTAVPDVKILSDSPTLRIAGDELRRDLKASALPVVLAKADDPALASLRLATAGMGTEGYLIRPATIAGRPSLLVTGRTDTAVLYGAFAVIRAQRTGADLAQLNVASAPKVKLRVLNHWDNLDGSVERGYAGQSLWDWWTLPDFKDQRYTDYARANASLGINGVVLNNVNAKPESLSAAYIAKAAALAEVFRPWGIKVYLSARFSAPIELGGLKTADPLDPQVAAWWQAKSAEIYRAIPDFGGFLVKANSEGQPGPRDYHRSHAEGANMLAAAVAPHGGVVMWRAFVYAETDPDDRAKQAYTEFRPLDGKFADNVLVQVKNGAIDFQPREPFHPLFGAMPRTPMMLELQITKEYLGFATHLAYLGPLFTEVLDADTRTRGKGSTVAKVVDGALDGHDLSGMAGVANIGRDRDWSGSTFNQANWYAFGRLAWNPALSADVIAREWAEQTFGADPRVVDAATSIMMESREALVDYTGPLGLAHLMDTGHHYGPGPWVDDLARPEWNPTYYHKADRNGIGFDRTRTGSNAIAQYAPAVARRLADPRTTPEEQLLWFHHLPWDWKMQSGRTLWEQMVSQYDRGVTTVERMQAQWRDVKGLVDEERWNKTAAYLQIQVKEARWWRDASLAYWMSVNGLSLPTGSAAPAHELAWYKAQRFPLAPGQAH